MLQAAAAEEAADVAADVEDAAAKVKRKRQVGSRGRTSTNVNPQ